MPKRLEFISYSRHRRDPEAFKRELRRAFPTVIAADLEKIATVELWKVKPRLDHTEVLLFGRDVLTDDVTTIAGWDVMSAKAQKHVRKHERAGTLPRLVSIDGLSRTYVFNRRNEWVQEVSDADMALIRAVEATPEMIKRRISRPRHWFRDIDVYGPWQGFPRTWTLPVVEEFKATNLDDAKRFVADVKKTKQWPGRG
jgi:hypothetical protein